MFLSSPEFRSRLKRLRLAAEKLGAGVRRGQRQSRALGAGLEFAGHRAYSPGDDVRYLDWNALGRLDTLVLKQFEAPGELTVVAAPDLSPTMHFGEPDKAAAALALAAATGYIALHAGDRVLLNPLGGVGLPRAFSGNAQDTEFLDALERTAAIPTAKAQPGQWLEGWLASIRALRGDVLVVMATDFLDRAQCLDALRELGRLRARTLVMHVVAPEELSPQLTGRTKIRLLGGGGERSTVTLDVTPAVLDDYRREFEQYRQAISHACQRARAGLIETATHAPLEDTVLGLVAAGVLRVRRG